MFHAETHLLTVGRSQLPIGGVYRRLDVHRWRLQRSPLGSLKNGCCRAAIEHLLERLCAVFLKDTIQTRENITVKKKTIACTHNPLRQKFIGNADARADIVGISIEHARQLLEVVS